MQNILSFGPEFSCRCILQPHAPLKSHTHTHTHIFTFSRRFYPKRLTVHSGYTFVLSVCVFPGNWTHNLCTTNAMLYHWAKGTLLSHPTFKRVYSPNNFKFMLLKNVLINVMCMDSCFCSTLASCLLIFASYKSHTSSKKTVKTNVMLEL